MCQVRKNRTFVFEKPMIMPIHKIHCTMLGILLGFLLAHTAIAQPLTLERCKQLARDNYPAVRQYDLIGQSARLTLDNAMKAWLPDVSVSGIGVGMTDVQKASPLGEMKNGVYGASVSVRQTVYDGGQIGAQRQLAQAQADVDRRTLDVQMDEVDERVEQLFFGVLQLDEQRAEVQLLQEQLALSEQSVRRWVQHGLASESDLDLVAVQQLEAEQQLLRIAALRRTYADMLGYFIGRSPLTVSEGEDLQLQRPTAEAESRFAPRLAETSSTLSLFSAQESLLDVQRKSLNSRLRPTVGLFLTGAYHNRLMPIVRQSNLMAGVSVSWKFGALYTRKNDLALLAHRREQIGWQREAFLFNNGLQQREAYGEIASLRQQMRLDDHRVALQENILKQTRLTVEKGPDTVNELLRQTLSVSKARQQRSAHAMLLLQATCRLQLIQEK